MTYLQDEWVDEVFCAFPPGDNRVLKWFRLSESKPARFRIIPELGLPNAAALQVDFYHEVPVLMHRKQPLEYVHNRLLKRFLTSPSLPW
ncbi:MAG: hypothetical protein U5L96_12615 [Owenweeksia sp.]|nr:hypothetical protein [Owenweeksia sp.]